METSYTKTIKPAYANDENVISKVSVKVRRILAGIVHEDNDPDEHYEEVQLHLQPRPDGALTVIGWIGRPAVKGIPNEEYDEEIEEIPPLMGVEQTRRGHDSTGPISPFIEKSSQERFPGKQNSPFLR